MTGTILDIINGGSIWLLLVNVGGRIVEQPIEPRYLADIVAAESLSTPSDLVGREVELSEDGTSLGLF